MYRANPDKFTRVLLAHTTVESDLVLITVNELFVVNGNILTGVLLIERGVQPAKCGLFTLHRSFPLMRCNGFTLFCLTLCLFDLHLFGWHDRVSYRILFDKLYQYLPRTQVQQNALFFAVLVSDILYRIE